MTSNLIILLVFSLLFIGLYIFFERLFVIRASAHADGHFIDHIRDIMHKNKLEAAIEYCQNSPGPKAKMIEKGLERIGRPLSNISQAMEDIGKLEIYHVWKKCTRPRDDRRSSPPMLGFLGTIIRMIKAREEYNYQRIGPSG